MAQILGRTPEGIQLINAQGGAQQPVPGNSKGLVTTPDGKLVCVGDNSVQLVDLTNSKQAVEVAEAGVVLSAVSSTGAYLVTCTRPGKAEDGALAKNLKVWEVSSGQLLLSLAQKQVAKDNWPVLHWTHDDSALVHMVTNTLHVYSRADSFASYKKVVIKGVSGLELSPVPAPGSALPLVAAFVPEIKGSPAAAGLYPLQEGAEPAPLVRKSFFRTQGAKMMWNSTGTACLVLSYADYDATNQSYYGEQKLHFLPPQQTGGLEPCTVPLPKEGPVHDVQWSPTGDYFITVAGFMPAKVTLFNAACKPVYDLGSGPYSMVRWNPFGRFFAIAGFGNLPGDIVFFDKKTSGTCKQMGAVRSPAVAAEWSPDGRMLLTATTCPRLRVDNNVKVFTYYGEQRLHVPFATLYDAAWRPVTPGTFADRPQSPNRLEAVAKGEASTEAETKPSYVPPHLRAAGATAPPPSAVKFSLARDDDDRPGRIKTGAFAAKRLPPGAEFIAPAAGAKAASKNAKRRSKKKGAGEASGDADGDEGDAGEGAQQAEGAAEAEAALASASLQDAPAAASPADSEEAKQKRIRALQKKARQIAQLREKLAGEGDKALTPEQREKLASEAGILQELASLGASA